MRINNNIMALNAHRNLGVNTSKQTKSLEKLSSGLRINRAADDAAGLSISEKMRSQIRGLKQASKNAQDGISFLQTAEGAMDEVSSMLTRLKELAVQRATGTYDDVDKQSIELEVKELATQINDIITTTDFNGNLIEKKLEVCVTDDDAAAKVTLGAATDISANAAVSKITGLKDIEVGKKAYTITNAVVDKNGAALDTSEKLAAALEAGEKVYTTAPTLEGTATSGSITGVTAIPSGAKVGDVYTYDGSASKWKNAEGTEVTGITVTGSATNGDKITVGVKAGTGTEAVAGTDYEETAPVAASGASIADFTTANIEAAIKAINTVRSTFGAQQNRLESTVNNLNTTVQNLTDAESRVRDTDMAQEMASYTKNNILVQAATAMLAQANQAPQSVLSLLQ